MRMNSEERGQQIRTALTKNYDWSVEFKTFDEVILPHWGVSECPWCAEFESLARVSRLLPEPPSWLRNRLLRLSERERGLMDDPLLMLPGVESPRLGNESPVGEGGLSAVGVLVTLAAGLQVLRTDQETP